MKYEISQEQYVTFLNKLTPAQQAGAYDWRWFGGIIGGTICFRSS